ncbi:MAG: GGDEF domain-containing protein [Pseudomonadota bacterium]
MIDSPHAKQLADGFRWLRFGTSLEGEFREQHLASIRPRILICIVLSMAFSLFAAFSNRSAAAVVASTDPALLDTLRVFVVRPLSLAMLLIAFVAPLYRRLWLTSTPLILALIGSYGAIATAGHVADGNQQAFVAMLSGFLAVYLLMGMLFWHALIVAATISVTYLLSLLQVEASASALRFEAITLVAMSVLALVFIYHLEHSLRESFLQRRVLQDLGEHDGLTGLRNRRAFDASLQNLWRQALRDGQTLGLLMIDVDHFKPYNDHYGHQAGDRCLAKIGALLADGVRRPLDVAARIGGEEFAILLYGADAEHVLAVADSIVANVRLARLPHAKSSVSERVTVSVGASVISPRADRSPASLMQYVDEALYQAKETGRDKVVFREHGYDKVVTGVFRKDRADDAANAAPSA